jgi:hypothetical protein
LSNGCQLPLSLPRRAQGASASAQFPGVWGAQCGARARARARARCCLGPFPFVSAIKCHQKSTCNSAGSSVGSLAPPRATHPAAGRCGRVVPVLPLLLCTRPAPCARPACLRLGVKAPPSHSALDPVGSSPGLALSPVTALQFSRFAHRDSCLQTRAMWLQIGYDYSQPAHASPNLISSPTKSLEVVEWVHFGLPRQHGSPEVGSLDSHRFPNHNPPRCHSRPQVDCLKRRNTNLS